MEKEFWMSVGTIIAIAVSRVLSHFEHRKTEKKVNNIMNGELKELIKEAIREEIKK